MSRVRFLVRRFGWALFATWLVLTATFVLVAAPPDPNAAAIAFTVQLGGGDGGQALEQYRQARGLNQPLAQRYLTFMTDFLTLKWGTSFAFDRPVADLVAERSAITLAYLVPSVVLSTAGGFLLGLYVTVKESSVLDRVASGVAYAGLGLPNFWIALALLAVLGGALGFDGGLNSGFTVGESLDPLADLTDPKNAKYMLFPVVALSATLLGAQLRYVRSETRNYLREDFVKLVRSKGASKWRVTTHALRNAALPLVSLLFTELLGVLLVSVFVIEVALGLPGLGTLTYTALDQRDVPVVVVSVLLPVFVGVFGNFAQDLLYAVLDPRIDAE